MEIKKSPIVSKMPCGVFACYAVRQGKDEREGVALFENEVKTRLLSLSPDFTLTPRASPLPREDSEQLCFLSPCTSAQYYYPLVAYSILGRGIIIEGTPIEDAEHEVRGISRGC